MCSRHCVKKVCYNVGIQRCLRMEITRCALSQPAPPDVNKERRGSTPARFTRVRLAHLLVVGLLLGLNGWRLQAQDAEPQVPQGGSATFSATAQNAPLSGAAEIAAPDGSIIATFSDPSGGTVNDWTVSITGESSSSTPIYTVTAPADAPIGTGYEVRSSSYYYFAAGSAVFEVIAGTEPTPTPTPEASPTPTPDVEPTPTPKVSPTPTPTPVNSRVTDALIRISRDEAYIGNNLYSADGANQIAKQLTVPDSAAIYHLQIQNQGASTTTFRVSGPQGSDGWTLKYFDALTGGAERTLAVTGDGWTPPPVAPNGSYELRLEVTAAQSVAATETRDVTLLVCDAADESRADAVKTQTSLQKLAKLQWSLNHGQSWADTPPDAEAPTAALNSVVGFRVTRANPNAPWPDLPNFKPTWQSGGRKHIGDEIWVHCPTATPAGGAGESVTAECGNHLSAAVRVLPDE